MFRFWGDGSQESMDLVSSIRVRSTENFNWTFIFILAVVFYVYWTEIHKKNTLVGDPQKEYRGGLRRPCAVRRALAV